MKARVRIAAAFVLFAGVGLVAGQGQPTLVLGFCLRIIALYSRQLTEIKVERSHVGVVG